MTLWFTAVTRKAGAFRPLGLIQSIPVPRQNQLLSNQSGRRFYSLTLTSFLSQGFHTLPASLFWGSNILPRKKLFPTSNLKHCCNCSHHFLSPCPWTWRTDYSLCSAAAFYTLQPCFPTSFSFPHTEICEHCQWLPSLAHLGWT